MWERLGHREGVVDRTWPEADVAAARDEVLELAVQINGKVRGHIRVPRETPEEDVKRLALEEPKVKEQLVGTEIVKLVVVPGRLVSVVVR
jgi:leucyl-tRNA synthetase